MSRPRITKHLCRLSDALLVFERAARGNLEKSAIQGSGVPVAYVDVSRYDETPMKTTLSSFVMHVAEHQLPLTNGEIPASEVGFAKVIESLKCKSSGPARLFQTQSCFGMLLRAPEPAGSAQEHVAIQGETLNWVQVLSSTSAASLKEALRQTSAVSIHSKRFPFKVRLASSDSAASCIRCETDIARKGGRLDQLAHCVPGAHSSQHSQEGNELAG